MQILNNNNAWRNKKHNVVLGLLDIALFLALAGRFGLEDLLYHDDPLLLEMAMDVAAINGPVTGLTMNNRYLEFNHGEIYNSKLDVPHFNNLLSDYETVMDDTERRITFQSENVTDGNFTEQEVNTLTAMVLQISPNGQPSIEIEEQIVGNENADNLHEQSFFPNLDMPLPVFDVFDFTLNMERDDLAEAFSNEQNEQLFDNTEEVRWQDFVVNSNLANQSESPKQNENITEIDFQQDIEFLNDTQSTSSNNTTRPRTTSLFSDESGIDVEEFRTTTNHEDSLSDHKFYTKQTDNTVQNTNISTVNNFTQNSSIASTSNNSTGRHNMASQHTVKDIEQQDMDLMQSMYQQDVDLGFEWQHIFEPNRQAGKDVNETKVQEKTDNQLGEFFVDGETGEQIPINPNQMKNQLNNSQQVNKNQTNPQTQIDFDEYLDMLETSIDTVQPAKNINQNDSFTRNRNDMVRNLSSLIEPLENGTDNAPMLLLNQSNNIWEDIENLSELTGLNLQANQPQDSSNIVRTNVRLSNATAFPQVQQQQERRNLYNQTNLNYNNKYDPVVQTEIKPQASPPAYLMPNYPTPPYNPSPQNSPLYGLNNEDGIPMEEGLSPGRVQDGGFLLNNQLNEFRHQSVDMGEAPLFGAGMMNPHLALLPEPGQGFFDQSPPSDYSKMMPDMVNGNAPVNTFGENNNNSPFMNPSQMPYVPPPLVNTNNNGSSLQTFQGKGAISTVERRAISESYEESDSGVSMEHSPQGFNTTNMFDDSSFQSLLDDQSFQLTEITAINHNHTYDGTPNGTKPKTLRRKKNDGSATNRESRDEKKARELNIPFTLDEIILSAVEDYNEMLARTPLSPEQHTLIKDIRRRGKNKVAAQNCRKRKIETITGMEDDVDLLRQRKQQLVDEQHDMDEAKDNIKLRYTALYQQIFSSLRDDAGRPYDSSRFSLEQVEGAILLVQRVNHDDRRRHNDNHDNQQPMDQDDGRVDFSKVKLEKQE